MWRRIEIPSVYGFWDLHVAIQDAMGWNDSHLHAFSRPSTELGPGEVIGIPDPDGEIVTRAGWETPCTYWLRRAGDRLRYEYDFGDGWLHEIVLEAILDPEPRKNLPRCIEGARACPPEACGGPHGYAELLSTLRDPGHPEHASMCEWLGRRFDPEKFSAKTVHFDDAGKRLKLALGLPGASRRRLRARRAAPAKGRAPTPCAITDGSRARAPRSSPIGSGRSKRESSLASGSPSSGTSTTLSRRAVAAMLRPQQRDWDQQRGEGRERGAIATSVRDRPRSEDQRPPGSTITNRWIFSRFARTGG